MRRPAAEVRALVEKACHARGASGDEAAIFADVLVEAELRGRTTHGLSRLPGLLESLKGHTPGTPEIVEERGPLLVVDGRDRSGYLVGAFLVDEAVRVARSQGFALAGARNTRHCGMLGYYASRAAEQDTIAVMCADCSALVAPWGGTSPVLGTNPIAAAFPSEPAPILIDFGTSATTYGALDQARREGRPVPEGAALDAEGRPTTDPGRVRTILPMAGHKGYALGLLVQLLSGVLVGAAAVPSGYRDYGLFLLAMQTDLFAPRDRYDAGVRDLIRQIKAVPRRQGFDEILIPGERCFRERSERLKSGIEIGDAFWKELVRLAG